MLNVVLLNFRIFHQYFFNQCYGSSTMVPVLWSQCFDPCIMIPVLWSLHYGPCAMVPAVWSQCYGPFAMVPVLWSLHYGPCTMVPSLCGWVCFTILYLSLVCYLLYDAVIVRARSSRTEGSRQLVVVLLIVL